MRWTQRDRLLWMVILVVVSAPLALVSVLLWPVRCCWRSNPWHDHLHQLGPLHWWASHAPEGRGR